MSKIAEELKVSKVVEIPELAKLQLPDMTPRALFNHFGPGMLLMMTGIGTSHLVTAPVAGAQFQYALLWSVLVSYVFKYYGFEMAFRFTNSTGKSILDAMCTTKGKWAIWYTLIATLIQAAVGQAGRVIATAAVMYFLFTQYLGWPFDLWHYGAFLGVLCCTIVLAGQYKAIEVATKILVILLVTTTFYVFFYDPPPITAYTHFFIFDIPAGSMLILAAFLGLLPTGIDVALQSSEWGKARKSGLPLIRKTLEEHGVAGRFDSFNPKTADLAVDINKLSPHAQEYCRRWFKIGSLDFGIGHFISFVIATMFLLLSAMWIYPNDVSGRGVMGIIAKMFTESVGPGMMYMFLIGAFAATFSTALNYYDGWPRVVGACCRNLFKKTADLSGIDNPTPEAKKVWYSEYNIWRITMMYSLITSVLIIYGFQSPVALVLIASATALGIAPVIFYYTFKFCREIIPKDNKVFYPSKPVIWFTWLSLIIFTGMTLLVLFYDVIAKII
ncbi:MAG: Nramp family divalent metal transporter [Clostridia bacterium]|nr:Nramp family divalent metal transporter [Clostridia bacterium]